ncbi:Hypothetical protein PHPALM_37229 [Phytophthora palmivora]|uniref:Uncharacterized protein n=1 Tax=Phytophthora palmivora TaxID=4796 RepID=A0A2P4WXZ3_9STRA|nr:Hypothetical protein PHPALM_37229 [Phytophthora palmivora]
MKEYLSTLPSFSRGRNDPARCKFDHVTNATDDNLLIKHNLRRIVTTCRSGRCKASGVVCTCTYRLLLCEQSGIGSITVDGQHTMQDPDAPSPKSQHLTSQMRTFIEERLGEDVSIKPLDLFAWLIKKVDNGVFRGFTVQAYVKRLRKKQQTRYYETYFGELCKSHV